MFYYKLMSTDIVNAEKIICSSMVTQEPGTEMPQFFEDA
jgi:hypothetical protein